MVNFKRVVLFLKIISLFIVQRNFDNPFLRFYKSFFKNAKIQQLGTDQVDNTYSLRKQMLTEIQF